MRNVWKLKHLLLLACALTFVAAGCKDTPTKVYKRALKARDKKEKDKYLRYFTSDSRKLIEKLLTIGKVADQYRYLKDPWSLLPYTDIAKEVIDEEKGIAVLTTKKRGAMLKVTFVKEGGEWRIDATQLPTLLDRPLEK
ncbi:MAG: hypothetical protein KC609_08505 [Myxococcales bacterium]|nr:hypothetical protein [Myxococcales bacterium]